MSDFIEYGWEDEISDEGTDYVLLPEGDYDFTVKTVERARHGGSEKVPPCNMAKVTFTVWGAEDSTEITENYFLCNKFEWKLSQLFLSVGLKKRGEPLRMNWTALPGKTGKCSVYINKYTKKDGSEGRSNRIKKLYAYDENVETTKPTNPAAAAPQNQSGGFGGGFGGGGFGGGGFGGFGGEFKK